ncbi:MAG: hypothetical protein QM778_10805 [Myxococcales bacterium]
MARTEEGLRNEALRVALANALQGSSQRLEDLLARHGALPSARPNLTLAAAFGVEVAQLTNPAERLLLKLGGNDAAPDTPEAFLPVAAAHGWTALLREGKLKHTAQAWAALAELAADERAPVRIGTLDALVNLALREGFAEQLVAEAQGWLELEDREIRFGSTGLALEVVGEPRIIAMFADPEPLLAYVSAAIAAVADAPRSAERSEGRRRLLLSLPRTLTNLATGLRAGEQGIAWLTAECESAKHPDVRRALSMAAEHLRTSGRSQGVVAEQLKQVLEGSAKPLRDPSRVRPGTGRGKSSRRTR